METWQRAGTVTYPSVPARVIAVGLIATSALSVVWAEVFERGLDDSPALLILAMFAGLFGLGSFMFWNLPGRSQFGDIGVQSGEVLLDGVTIASARMIRDVSISAFGRSLQIGRRWPFGALSIAFETESDLLAASNALGHKLTTRKLRMASPVLRSAALSLLILFAGFGGGFALAVTVPESVTGLYDSTHLLACLGVCLPPALLLCFWPSVVSVEGGDLQMRWLGFTWQTPLDQIIGVSCRRYGEYYLVLLELAGGGEKRIAGHSPIDADMIAAEVERGREMIGLRPRG